MDQRSIDKDNEKKNRSDGCNRDCRFKDLASGKCIFETCLLEELPPLQLKSQTVNCSICNASFSNSSMGAFLEDRICPTCRPIIKLWIDNHKAILEHIKHPI